jgi:hypothetical protein
VALSATGTVLYHGVWQYICCQGSCHLHQSPWSNILEEKALGTPYPANLERQQQALTLQCVSTHRAQRPPRLATGPGDLLLWCSSNNPKRLYQRRTRQARPAPCHEQQLHKMVRCNWPQPKQVPNLTGTVTVKAQESHSHMHLAVTRKRDYRTSAMCSALKAPCIKLSRRQPCLCTCTCSGCQLHSWHANWIPPTTPDTAISCLPQACPPLPNTNQNARVTLDSCPSTPSRMHAPDQTALT